MVTKTDVIKYTVLPGIVPRLLSIFQSGFVHTAYLIALVYQAVRLLPHDHPYLEPQNFGRYGIRHVIAEAANNIVLDRKHIDRILIFFIILVGLVLLFAQFIMLILAAMAGNPAFALAVTDLLSNPVGGNAVTGSRGPGQDLAFIILDRIFGVPGIFDSCVSNVPLACTYLNTQPVPNTAGAAFPWPFHEALHQLFSFYSLGIFFVGVFVLIYFITTIVAETAQTGTPFGQRFNKTWAPVRLILFLALLIPLPAANNNAPGLNGAQFITLRVAKLGSNFATNGWSYFNRGAVGAGTSDSYLSQQKDLIAQSKINIERVAELMQFITVAKTCQIAYNLHNETEAFDVEPYLVRSTPSSAFTAPAGIDAARNNALEWLTTNYGSAQNFTLNGDIVVRFGQLGTDVDGDGDIDKDDGFGTYKGDVKPLCGELTFSFINATEPGALSMLTDYYTLVQDMWQDTDLVDAAVCTAQRYSNHHNQDPTCTPIIDRIFIEREAQDYQIQFVTAMQNGITAQRAGGLFNMPNELLERGWAGAAIWYNRIAAMNGALTDASMNIPQPSRLPFLMEAVLAENTKQNSSVTGGNQFSLLMSDKRALNLLIDLEDPKDYDRFVVMNIAYDAWVKHQEVNALSHRKPSGNAAIDMINALLGTNGLFEMRENTDVHPLAQLSALGKGMMDAVVRNLAVGTALKMGTDLFETITHNFSGEAVKGVSSFLFAFVSATIGMSVILYYILPLMPFIYFLFAVSGWIKSIFEAMVAMPLWALAHLKIDGEGVAGPSATNGYFLLLEIFIRPILILFGLVASITTFSALVGVLNIVFDSVVANVGGFDTELDSNIRGGTGPAGMVSQLQNATDTVNMFFYTAMYAIICYMMGLASFKLVDLIPNQILRWMGVNVNTFQESAGDPVASINSQVQRGSILVANQLRGNKGGDLAAIAG